MRVVFLTESVPGGGLGHVMRCSAYAAAFHTRNIPTVFVVRGGGKSPISDCLEADWALEPESFVSSGDCAIVDSYHAHLSVYERIGSIASIMAYLDDSDRLPYPNGYLINSAMSAEKLYGTKRAGTVYLTGSRYAALREPFLNVSQKHVRPRIENIMITTGSENPGQLAECIVESLTGFACMKTLIVGPGFKTKPEAAGVAHVIAPDAFGMRDTMLSADIAVTTAGQSVYEFARCGVPFIPIVTAENQRANVMGLKDHGLIDSWVDQGSSNFSEVLSTWCTKMIPEKFRTERSRKLQNAIDGHGASRTADALIDAVAGRGI